MVKPDRTMTIDVGRYTAERSRAVYSTTITVLDPNAWVRLCTGRLDPRTPPPTCPARAGLTWMAFEPFARPHS